MTTAYTSLLGLALPVTGELSGTWGDTVNNSITSLLDTSVAGTTNVSTDTDVTLTTTTGAANTARQAILLFSGARTALRTVTAPAQSKIYTVINATTGGFSVKLVGVGPTTGVTIVAGESAVCAWNGSDFIKVSNTGGSASFTNVTVTGTTTLSGLTASTALALDASKNVVSVTNTGTGNNVLSASPTLTGTIGAASLTLSTDLTLSGGTANGVAYLNGSKVVTSGSALTFDGATLGVSNGSAGTAGISITGTYSGSGTVAFLNFQRAGGAVAGTLGYNDASTAIQFGTTTNHSTIFLQNNSEAMRLTSTGLGIGTSSPDRKLSIYTTDSAGKMALFSNGNTNTNLYLSSDPSSGGAVFNASNNAASAGVPFLWQLNGSEQMRLTSTGLGIGTSSPAYKLDVQGATGSTVSGIYDTAASGSSIAISRLRTTGTGLGYWDIRTGNTASGLTGALDFFDNIASASRVTISNSGNLGIGTSSPTRKLDVSGTPSSIGGAGTGVLVSVVNTGTAYNASPTSAISLWNKFNTAGSTFPSAVLQAGKENATDGNYAGYMSFITVDSSANPNERMRLDSAGNLGLNVTPSSFSGAKFLQINGSMFAGDDTVWRSRMLVNAYNDGSYRYLQNNYAQMYVQNSSSGDHTWYLSPSGTAGNAITFTQAMTLDASGNLGVGETSPTSRLHVSFTSNSVDNVIQVQQKGNNTASGITLAANDNNGAGYNFIRSLTTGGTTHWQISGGVATSTLAFSTGGSERMRIDSSGNVGIGATPSNKLYVYSTVNANTATTQANFVDGGSTGGLLYQHRINVQGKGGTGNINMGMTDNSSSHFNGQNCVFVAADTQPFMIWQSSAQPIIFATNGGEKVRIDSSGQVLIGTTSTSGGFPLRAKGGGVDGSTTVTVPSGVTTTIYTIPNSATACMCVVFGDNGSNGFCDLLFFLGNTTPQVVSSKTMYGSPPARTYSVASTTQLQLNVAMDSSTRTAVLGTIS